MGDLDSEFEFVIGNVLRASRLQAEACDARLASGREGGRRLAGHLKLLYESLDKEAKRRDEQYQYATDDFERADAIQAARILLAMARKFQSNFTWLDAAKTPVIDLGTSYFVESAARELIAPDVEVTIVPLAEKSYATSSNPWRPAITSWGSGIPAGTPTVVVVFIPRREERSGLLHPLIVHELGHAIDSKHGVVNEIALKAAGRQRFSDRFVRDVLAFAQREQMDALTARDHVSSRLWYWVAEAFCDSIAVQHLGPTYLYSFLVEVVSGNMDIAGPKHPPPRQRVRLLLEQLDRLGWSDVMRETDPALDAWIREIASKTSELKGIDKFLAWGVNELRALIRNTASRSLGDRVFRPDDAMLAEIASLIGAGVPPAQLSNGKVAPREAIILGCWRAAIGASGGGAMGLVRAADAPQLGELLPAGLELSAIAESWAGS